MFKIIQKIDKIVPISQTDCFLKILFSSDPPFWKETQKVVDFDFDTLFDHRKIANDENFTMSKVCNIIYEPLHGKTNNLQRRNQLRSNCEADQRLCFRCR